ncbi:hypothetical protein [Streptomyces sp. NPDC087212]|uniref:hypothetical protein n=1 Tax=Streptomyces sp. NPDC087212 TaxID=3365766 RepID=UPI0037FD685A
MNFARTTHTTRTARTTHTTRTVRTVRTTPPRPVDVAEVFPELAPSARPAIRLHPRAGGAFGVGEFGGGGPLLWPAEEPWPHCDGPTHPEHPHTDLIQ